MPAEGRPPDTPDRQDLRQAPLGLNASRIMIQSKDRTPYFRRLLQHSEHRLFSHTTQGHMAVLLPVVWIQGQKGERIDGCLEHINPVSGPVPEEAVSGIATLHIDVKGLAVVVSTPLLGTTANAVFVLSGEHGVVIFFVLIDQSDPGKDLSTSRSMRRFFRK